jgi:hypothetical protein
LQKIQIADDTLIDFTLYRLNRSRLISMQGTQQNKQFNAKKASYLTARDTYKDKLYADLTLTELYFDKPTQEEAKKFIQYDSFFSTKEINELPTDEKYAKFQDKIIHLMKV